MDDLEKVKFDLAVMTARFNALLEFMQISVNLSKDDATKISISDDKKLFFHEFPLITDVNHPR